MANDYTIKDSGERRKFSTGAVRDVKDNKGRYDLLPFLALRDLAIHYEKGARKYSDRNWENGIPTNEFFDSGLRHLSQFILGYKDEDHLIAAIWNLIGLRETLIRIHELEILPKELDTLPYIVKKEKQNECRN